jgi:hypothetical protein
MSDFEVFDRHAASYGDAVDDAIAFAALIGFVAFDLDLYSFTAAALVLFRRRDIQRARRVALYFDEVSMGCLRLSPRL